MAFACRNDLSAPAPDQLAVSNVTDQFDLALTSAGRTDTLRYAWPNTGTTAAIQAAINRAAGSVTLTVRGSTGTMRYQSGLETAGNFVSAADSAGTWLVEVALTGFVGQLSLHIQKAP